MLKIFNTTNCPNGRKERSKATLSISFKLGCFRISKAACRIIQLQPLQQVAVGYDEDEKEWYVFKTDKDGFVLRSSSTNDTGSCLFNSTHLAAEILKHINNQQEKSGSMLIAKTPVVKDGLQCYALIISSFKCKKSGR